MAAVKTRKQNKKIFDDKLNFLHFNMFFCVLSVHYLSKVFKAC